MIITTAARGLCQFNVNIYHSYSPMSLHTSHHELIARIPHAYHMTQALAVVVETEKC